MQSNEHYLVATRDLVPVNYSNDPLNHARSSQAELCSRP